VSRHDETIAAIIKTMRELAAPALPAGKTRIGFIRSD
jgi:hypothetical protein